MKGVILILAALWIVIGIVYYNWGHRQQTLVPSFDLARYMGIWYEIARYDHSFERGLEHVRAEYTLQPDGSVKVLNSGVDGRTGKIKRAEGNAHAGKRPGALRVSFFWIFYSDYNVLELGAEYDWALVGSRSSRYLWILSRTHTLPDQTLNHILHLAQQRGYNTGKLIFVEQE
ncbi:lipocalin family protein [uncultured Alistipes sp.]|jgi:hypothetical protein|uniref:lipocalin family protein n=1 Tax=uncultured Alistipes sp. TaxID=538949 RepID=UPI0025E87ACF|nr:lipocalin family protein [uncultured Alistipes sp.]